MSRGRILLSVGFSEFTYGFALTHCLIKALGSVLPKAPIFPSLIQEGSTGGGYDLKLPLVPTPLFLQFKLPRVLIRSSSLRPVGCPVPYYRMPLRTSAPNQHQLLLDLQTSEPLVFYAAPLFHEASLLDAYFLAGDVQARSMFVKPSKIGALDQEQHHVSYHAGSDKEMWIHSKAKRLDGAFSFESMRNELLATRFRVQQEFNLKQRALTSWEIENFQQQGLERIADTFRTYAFEREREYWEEPTGDLAEALMTLPPVFVPPEQRVTLDALQLLKAASPSEMVSRLAFFAQVHFGLTMGLWDAADSLDLTNTSHG